MSYYYKFLESHNVAENGINRILGNKRKINLL